MEKKTYILFLFLFLNMVVKSQDIQFSQFAHSPLFLNPSLTGNLSSDHRITLINRSQWSSVTIPYKTSLLSYDYKMNPKKLGKDFIGTGLLMSSDKAGDSQLQTFNLELSISYIKNIKMSTYRFGVLAGLGHKSINYKELTFDQQYNGDVFDSRLYNGEVALKTNKNYPDFSLGMSWEYKPLNRNQVTLGWGFFHLNKPDDSFLGSSQEKIDIKSVLHISFSIEIHPRIDILPGLLGMNQYSANELLGGADLRLNFNESTKNSIGIIFGTWFRKDDALIYKIGAEYLNIKTGLSYDVNVSRLIPASMRKGGFEFSLIYLLHKAKPEKLNKTTCPVYF